MCRKALLLFCLLTGVHARLLAVDVLLSEVAVLPATPASSAAIAELNARSAVSMLLHGELARRSSWVANNSGEIEPDPRWRLIWASGSKCSVVDSRRPGGLP